MNKLGGINTFQLGAESFSDKIYYYSKNYITWTTYDKETNNYTTKYKPIKIPSFLHWPFLRCLRMLYAKKQLVGNKQIIFTLIIILLQYLISLKYTTIAFIFPYVFSVGFVLLTNYYIKKFKNPTSEQLIDTMKNHAAEHWVSEKEHFNKDTIYSFGCSNSHLLIWFVINLIFVWFMPVTNAYLLSMLISGEIGFCLVFNQNSWLANLFYPFMIWYQSYTLLNPDEQHIKTAQLAYDKLEELEDAQ